MAEVKCLDAQGLNRHLNPVGFQKSPAIALLVLTNLNDTAAHHIGWLRLIRAPPRLGNIEEHRQNDVARILQAGGQLAIRVERPLRLAEQGQHFLLLRVGRRPLGDCGRHQRHRLGDVAVTRIDLWLEIKNCIADDLGLCRRQLVDQTGMDVPRPRPATQIGNAMVINGDDRNLLRRFAVGQPHGHVVSLALQALE